MTAEMKLIIAVSTLVGLVVLVFVYRQIPKRLKRKKFTFEWKKLQSYCRDPSTWADAIKTADKLLDQALKKRKFKGRSMGERMVSAQHKFSDNDSLWYAHNLCKKLKADADLKLNQDQVKDALVGFRQALRDLGALEDGKPGRS